MVRRRHHVVDSVIGQDLSLIEDDQPDLRNATSETVLPCPEQDPGAIAELDRTIARAATDAAAAIRVADVRFDPLTPSKRLHLPERLTRRLLAVRRPQHQQAGTKQAERKHDAADEVGLADLPSDRHHHPADAGGVETVFPLSQDATSRTSLPALEPDPEVVQFGPNTRPAGRDNPHRKADRRNIRQPRLSRRSRPSLHHRGSRSRAPPPR